MSRVLLVTQTARGYGEFRRPWVRALYRRYAARYRRVVTAAARRLVAQGASVVMLATRDFVDAAALPAGVDVRWYDEESLKVDPRDLVRLNEHLSSGWWAAAAPELVREGVSLPDLLTQARGLVMQLEVTEPFGVARGVLDEIKPERVVLVSGASTLERLCRLLAEHRGLRVDLAAPAFLGARLYARALRMLQRREERLRLLTFIGFPRRAPAAVAARPVVFVTCRPRHHFVVDPLVEAITAAGVEPHVLATPVDDPELDARIAGLQAAGVRCGRLSDYLSADDARRIARRSRRECRALWRRLTRDGALARALEWEGVPLGSVARPIVRDTVQLTLPVAALFQEAAFRALDALAPRAVVITSNRRYAERALALAARARGVPCLLFSGTLLMGHDRYEFLDVADRLLVIGPHLREGIVREQAVSPSKIAVVGDPRSNAARMVEPARLRAEVVRDLGLAPDRPLVVFVSKYVSRFFTVAEKEAFYRTMAAALPTLPPVNLVVKVHPNELEEFLVGQVRDWGLSAAVMTKSYDVHRLFGAADAAVMVTSMAGIEAMALGCPVIAVQAAGKSYEASMPPYVSEGVVERVTMGDAPALAAALRRMFDDTGARADLVRRGRAFASRYVHPVDGALAERVLATIEDARAALTEEHR